MGDAMNTDEYVPTSTPIRIASAKSLSTGPPPMYSASTVTSVMPPVSTVRPSVSLMLAFMISRTLPLRPSRRPLRIRSYTTMVSLIE